MRTARILCVMLAGLAVLSSGAEARSGRRTAHYSDPRIRYITFNNDSVTTVPVGLGVSTMVQFQADEMIETISAGETKTWSIVPKKGSSIMFVKPTEPGSRTNINVVTSKRVYALALVTSTSSSAIFQVRFRYPEDDYLKAAAVRAGDSAARPDLKSLNPASLNYNYVYKGSDALKPRVIFDNGVKTFFEFNGDVPSIFLVKEGGAESTVNSRREGRFIVVDKLAHQFTLRAGELETCVFNMNVGTQTPDDVETIYGPKKAQSGFFN